MKNLKVGQRIKFKKRTGYCANNIYTRKIHSIYKREIYDHETLEPIGFEYKYNTRGHNGGYGCNGFSVEENEIIKVF